MARKMDVKSCFFPTPLSHVSLFIQKEHEFDQGSRYFFFDLGIFDRKTKLLTGPAGPAFLHQPAKPPQRT